MIDHIDQDTGRWDYFDTSGVANRSAIYDDKGNATFYNSLGIEITYDEWKKIQDHDQTR